MSANKTLRVDASEKSDIFTPSSKYRSSTG
jgi:hypothetical protein